MPGPQETRLLQALNGTRPGNVDGHAQEWRSSALILKEVAGRLASTTMPIPDGDAGEKTAAAMNKAFAAASKAMYERAAKLDDGHGALTAASKAMSDAHDAHAGLGGEHPAPTYTPPDDPGSEAGIKHHNQYLSQMTTYQAGVDHREKVSKAHADHMDEVFRQSSATMKKIHGEPDPKPQDKGGDPGSSTGGGGGGTPRHNRSVDTVTPIHVGTTPTTTSHHHVTPTTTTTDPSPHHDPTSTTDPGAHIPGPTDPGGTAPGISPIGTSPGSSDPGGGGLGIGTGVGVVGATGAGAGAGVLGAGLMSGLRGGVVPISGTSTGVPTGTAQSAVRGIGTTTRLGGSSTLGRSSSAAESESAGSSSRAGAAGSGGRSTGRAGGRGAGAGVRGRGKDDKKGKKRDLFDVDEDWVDDEEAAPSLLD